MSRQRDNSRLSSTFNYTQEALENNLNDWSSVSASDARRSFVAETNLSARMSNTADEVLNELQLSKLFSNASPVQSSAVPILLR